MISNVSAVALSCGRQRFLCSSSTRKYLTQSLQRESYKKQSQCRFSSETGTRPVRKAVSQEERAALRAARKERATQMMAAQQQQKQQSVKASVNGGSTNKGSAPIVSSATSSRWIWYAGAILPPVLIAWGVNDETSPPAQFSQLIGLTNLIEYFSSDLVKPSHAKLLPDWDQMPNVPHDIPVPHTLVLDLEDTLVSSTWDRKYGWRHAKRPGVDQFLSTLAHYYEIVLYSPSVDGLANPVVDSLDKTGCIMHRLFRDATHYKNGVHVKDLNALNRSTNRMILIDDDPDAAQLNPENLIRIKPYLDPNDRTDKSLVRLIPFLIEIARNRVENVPALLEQFRGMDADEIADEYERRIESVQQARYAKAQRGLGGLASRSRNLEEPELTPVNDSTAMAAAMSTPQQLTARDLVGQAPTLDAGGNLGGGGMKDWINRRAKEKEEQQMRKLEKWNQVQMKRQQERQQAAASK